MSRRPSAARTLAVVVFALSALPAAASHFRGGNVNVQVTAQGIATFTYETLWRKGSAFFPFDGVGRIQFFAATDVSRVSPLRTVTPSIGNTTVFRDVSDPAFDFRRQVVVVDLPALGLAQGRYVARWENCCRIGGIANAPESSFSLEAVVLHDGTANGSPVLNSRILTVVGKGLPYRQNLNAFDPDDKPLSYAFLVGSSRPNLGPSSQVPGITLDAAGQIEISAQSTATLRDVNPFNPAGDYVFKVRVIDADGVFSERDVLLDVVATANQPPDLLPIGHRVLEVGESLVLPVGATDPNPVDRVGLRTSELLPNMVFVSTPGNPATGTLAFRPTADQVGVIGVNVEAQDNGVPVLTDSELVLLTVLDPDNRCPVLAAIGNREVAPGETLAFTVGGGDADVGQILTFSASFLPAGASFDPATRTFAWTPTAAQAGVHLGTVFEMRDNAAPPCADREVVGFSVQPANRFPVLEPIGHRAAAEEALISFFVDGADPDGGAVQFTAAPLPLGATFSPSTRRFTWTPTRGQAGIYEVTFSVTDGGSPALADSETVRMTVARTGEEAIRLVGVAEGQSVAGTVIVEAQVESPFPIVHVDFAIDGQPVNRDLAAPFFLGGEAGGLPLGFDTAVLGDGVHVLEATAVDTAGQATTAQRQFSTRNFVPPQVTAVNGLLDGGVASGTIDVEAEAIDDQRVVSVAFAIDGNPVNTETVSPYFLNGSRFAQGTFDVSCRVCLEVGDREGDLVVVDLEEDGTLARLCQGVQSLHQSLYGGAGTPDGDPPSDETVCDDLSGRAFGLCTAFCEAQDCDAPGKKNNTSCDQLRENYGRLTGDPRFPCERTGSCIESITLGLIDDPTRFGTFDPEDFTGDITTFELPFAVPLGFDTTSLADGEHTLTITATDNQGLTGTMTITFFVQNGALPPDALKVRIGDPAAGESFESARVVPVTAVVESAQGPVTVAFYADGRQVATDAAEPFETAVLVPDDGSTALTLHAVARDGRGPRQSAGVVVGILPRPEAPAPIAVLAVAPDHAADGFVAVDSAFVIDFTGAVDPGTLAGSIRLSDGTGEIAIDLELADDATVLATPAAPLAPDTLHVLVVDGVRSLAGARAPRRSDRFVTFPDVAHISGRVLDSGMQPIAGIPVRVGPVATVSDADGIFRLTGIPTGPQHLIADGGTVNGRFYPPLEFPMEIRAGLDGNRLERPIFLPALDLAGGLDVTGGVATGDGILRSLAAPGVELDLRGVSVQNPDGSPFTGRMSITPVPAPNVPMPAPIGVFSSLYITVQPGSLHLVPPAPITYPNLDGGLPGEQVPLWHFDHGIGAWNSYGTGVITPDGSRIVSRPGEGLPETGWGSPQPPNTFTTVVGTVVDNDGSPLHGCRVVAGNIEGFTRDDGGFTLANVPAGRQGSPIQIRVNATALDIEDATYNANSNPVTAVQNGTTDVGQVRITTYAPILADRIKLHADFQDAARRHLLRTGSPHAGEQRYRREVEELQRRLAALGFRQGGSTTNHGQPLVVNGTYGDDTRQAVRLFQSLELHNGNEGTLGGDGIFGRQSLTELNGVTVPLLWEDVGARGGVDYACPAAEVADGYGAPDIGTVLGQIATVAGNDASNPAGGNHPDHASHETGVDIDIALPRTDNGGCAGSPGYGQTTVAAAVYDRATMRQILRRAIDSGATTRRWLNDTVLQGETHNGAALCSPAGGHDDHLHIRIDPSAVASGVNATAAPAVRELLRHILAPASTGHIKAILVPGAGPDDVPVDATLLVTLTAAFDPETLNAATVRLEGPSGAVPGDVVADPSGLAVTFTPVENLLLATTYRLVLTSGAVLADGTILAEPAERSFSTEGAPSLRVAGVVPGETSVRQPLDTTVHVRFDGALDPTSVLPGRLRLVNETAGQPVPAALSLTEDGALLTLTPAAPLAEMSLHTLEILPGLRGGDGSPLVVRNLVTSFTTALAPGLERVEVAPAEVVFDRNDLSDVVLDVTGFTAGGATRDLASPVLGTDYFVERHGIIQVDPEGRITPTGNGEALLDVSPALEGFAATVRVKVDGVFPEVTFVGRQFGLLADDDVVVRFSERVDTAEIEVADVSVVDAAGQTVSGIQTLDGDGVTLTFDPAAPLPLRQQFVLRFDLLITDGQGVTRTFPRRLRFATAPANLGFELGDLSGFETEGDVEVVPSFGPLQAPEGDFMAKLRTSDAAAGGRESRLRAIDLEVPEGATRLAFTYNFLTDEIEQGQPFNDFFRATLILPDGSTRTILTVTRDQLQFSGSPSPVPGFDRMTGFRTGSTPVQAGAGGTCHLVFEALVSDAGDASIDSAVLVDDIRFE